MIYTKRLGETQETFGVYLRSGGQASLRNTFIRVDGTAIQVFENIVPPEGPEYFEAIGYNQLNTEMGVDMPTGSGVTLSHIQSTEDEQWKPLATGELSGANIEFRPIGDTSVELPSSTEIAKLSYGSESMSPSIDTIYALNGEFWITDDSNLGLRFPDTSVQVAPLNPPWDVELIGNELTTSQPLNTGAYIRSEYRIRVYDVSVILPLADNLDPVPTFVVAAMWNNIEVGVNSGLHSRLPNNTNKFFANVVAPFDSTQKAAAVTAAAVTLLVDHAKKSVNTLDAAHHLPVKALVLAGATKHHWVDYSVKTSHLPLDPTYGAGQVNLYNSMRILLDGRHNESSQPVSATKGWDKNLLSTTVNNRQYPFTSTGLNDISLALCWDRISSRGWNHNTNSWSFGTGVRVLPVMVLRLWSVDGIGNKVKEMAISRGRQDNLQHIHFEALSAGDYLIEVSGNMVEIEQEGTNITEYPYGLAWRTYNHIPKEATNFTYPSPSYANSIGYTDLKNEFGNDVPNGRTIKVGQVEYIRSNTWRPGAVNELAGKTIIPGVIDGTANSSHAYEVGQFFYGSNSMAFGVTDVFAFRDSHWTGQTRVFFPYSPPNNAYHKVENHSWGGTIGAESGDLDATLRCDIRGQAQNIVVVVGLDNNTGAMAPLIANTHNSISVGRSSGSHNRGGTNLFEVGRQKPDIVAPASFTSYSTPMVGAAAVILIEKAERSYDTLDAAFAPCIKALLMAGATKSQFAGWSNTEIKPLDAIYGAGQLNIHNSYKILHNGRHQPNTVSPSGVTGWDKNTLSETVSSRVYPLTLAASGDCSIMLCWNVLFLRAFDTTDRWQLAASGAYHRFVRNDLVLKLWTVDGNGDLLAVVSTSNSLIDNLQHIFTTSLSAGSYAIEVSGSILTHQNIEEESGFTEECPYGLAWRLL